MTVKEAAKYLGWSELFLREAIALEKVDFGVCVKMPGSSRRTFRINERKVEEWKNGTTTKKSQSGTTSD